MDKKEQILHFHRIDGLSLLEISRRVGVNRKTVTRYIREYEAQAQADGDAQAVLAEDALRERWGHLTFLRRLWEEVLKDKVLCSALVDRLCHKSYLVNMTGTSYRIKKTKKLNDNKQ